jgi:RNA recognition motif-containing protein
MGMREGNSVMTDTEQRKPFTLYVGNIHQCTTRNDLSKFFEDAGFKCDFVYTIKNVPGSNEKLNRPSAFVVLENPEQLRPAINKLDGAELHTRKIMVRHFKPNYRAARAEAITPDWITSSHGTGTAR